MTCTAGLVPGGGKARSDCYAELQVTNLEAATVKRGRIVACRDGDACDHSACGDDACTFEVGLCVNQNDPALDRCTPPAALSALDVSGPVVLPAATPPIEGAVCFAQVAVEVPLALDSQGRVKGPGSAKFRVEATAVQGTRPRGEVDRFVLKCTPRPEGCANTTTTIASSTTSTTVGTGSTTSSSTSTVPTSSTSSSTTSTSTSLPVGSTSSTSSSTTLPPFDCAITTATCTADACSCGEFPGLDYHLGATGTGNGPVGIQVSVNVQLLQGGVIDCGQWTKIGSAVNLSCDTIGCCERQSGQPEAMVWTAFENFDFPCFCPNFPEISANYLVQCQYLALPAKEQERPTDACS